MGGRWLLLVRSCCLTLAASTEAADKVFNLQGTRWTVFEGAANWWGDEAGAPKLCADKEKNPLVESRVDLLVQSRNHALVERRAS